MGRKRSEQTAEDGGSEPLVTGHDDGTVTLHAGANNGQQSAPVEQSMAVAPYGRLIALPGAPMSAWPTNIPLDSEEGKVALFNALGAPSDELDDNGNLDFDVWAYLAHPVEEVDPESGEVKNYSRLTLVSPSGRTFATTSEVVAHRLAALTDPRMYGAGPWLPPLKLTIISSKARRSKRTYHNVILRGR